MRKHSFILAVCLLVALLYVSPAVCEDTGYDFLIEDALSGVPSGQKPEILYTGRTQTSLNMRSLPDKTSKSLGVIQARKTVEIFGYDQQWLFCWSDSVGVYYLQRTQSIDPIEPVDPENTTPYGVVEHRYVAVTASDTVLRTAPEENAEAIETYPADTRFSFWFLHNGWAVVPYKRVVGYIYVGDLKDVTPVSPDIDYAQDGDILAAFTTFYSTAKNDLNVGRMENMRVGCSYIDRIYEPGFTFSFNNVAGPYRKARGYKPAPVLIDGATVAGYGGGTCQVSTTLYNALLQLPDEITILYRRPHGPGGANYAPHGVDAAVGNDNLDLQFRNDFDFPIRIESTVQNGAICICIRKASGAN